MSEPPSTIVQEKIEEQELKFSTIQERLAGAINQKRNYRTEADDKFLFYPVMRRSFHF